MLALAGIAPGASAQGTALVSLTDLAYRDVDRLVELGMLRAVIVGQRPYSREEFARLVGASRDRLEELNARQRFAPVGDAERAANGILQRLEARFGDESRTAPRGALLSLVDAASISFVSTDAVSRGFPGNLTRDIEASIEPLTPRRLGRRAPPGSTFGIDLQQRLEPFSWLAFRMRERLEYRLPNDTTRSRTDGEILLASARARAGNVAFTVGREQFAWAQREGSGLFLASDAPALDLVSIAGDRPFLLPGIFRALGATQATLFVADLGVSRVRSRSKLLGYKVSVQPHGAVELGGSFLNHFGGAGARRSSVGSQLIDFLPFIDIFRRHNYTDSTRALDVDSDKLLGVDGRWRTPVLGGVMLSGELLIDDFDVNRIRHLVTSYGSSTASVLFPKLSTAALSLELTAKHTGILTYAHGGLTNGIATRDRLIGDELGPDAKAFGARVRWTPAPALRVSLEGRSSVHGNADYAIGYTDSTNARQFVQKIAVREDELRDQLVGTIEFQSDEGLALVIRGGGERVRNFNFSGGRRREYLFDVALRLRQ